VIIKNYFEGKTIIILCCAFSYLVVIYFFVVKFNKILNNLVPSDFIGKDHLKAVLVAVISIVLTFFVEALLIKQFDYGFSSLYENFESSIGFVVVSVSEELVFRAFLFVSILKLSRRPLFSVLLSSLIFTLVHYHLTGTFAELFWVFSVSILITYLYLFTGSIVSPIIFHFLINLFSTNVYMPDDQYLIIILIQSTSMILLAFLIALIPKLNNIDHVLLIKLF